MHSNVYMVRVCQAMPSAIIKLTVSMDRMRQHQNVQPKTNINYMGRVQERNFSVIMVRIA